MTNRKRVGYLRNTTVDRLRRRTMTAYYSTNRSVRKETGDEGTERRMESEEGSLEIKD